MTMPGGGPHCVGPGQVTDDSELAMSMMWGILKGHATHPDEKNALDIDAIAKCYKRWMQSPPFDIGTTTSNAFGPLVSVESGFAKAAKAASLEHNLSS